MDTIFARSTAAGRAGVAIVRISGPGAWDAVSTLTRQQLPPVRQAGLRKIWYEGDLVDLGLVLLFREGHSFTGELSAELHLHGSEGVVRRVLEALGAIEGLRMAVAGEFTRRALENDCLDFAEVEGLNALLLAETEAQRRQAVRVLDGALNRKVASWRQDVVTILAALEVAIDFADEEVPQDVSDNVVQRLAMLADELACEADGAAQAAKVSKGFEVALVGVPNSGKSTLLNRLARREAALTSEIAGTTRDVLEVRLEIEGFLVTILDTAGIRSSTDVIETAGVARARDRANMADLRVFIDKVPEGISWCDGDVLVSGKCDIVQAVGDGLPVSGKTGTGVDELTQSIGIALGARVSEANVAMTLRQGQALNRAAESLREAVSILTVSLDQPEIVSDLVQRAVQGLDETVGRIGVEDVLGEIFSQFCIGK